MMDHPPAIHAQLSDAQMHQIECSKQWIAFRRAIPADQARKIDMTDAYHRFMGNCMRAKEEI
jgi:hypothetical protein